MDLSIGTPIYERNGQKIGELNRIVMDGKTGDVSHLVVGKGWLLPRDIVVSRDDIEIAEPDRIQLRLSEQELNQQPDFYEIHYVTPDANAPVPEAYASDSLLYAPIAPPLGAGWIMPYSYSIPPSNTEIDVNVPAGSVTLADGMNVWAGDEKVGTITGVRIHPRTEHISHIVVSHGWLFPEERIIPASAIRTVDQEGVHLAPSVDELRALPPAART
jgi:sporulation protein YlmC with PRC-barrel domain